MPPGLENLVERSPPRNLKSEDKVNSILNLNFRLIQDSKIKILKEILKMK